MYHFSTYRNPTNPPKTSLLPEIARLNWFFPPVSTYNTMLRFPLWLLKNLIFYRESLIYFMLVECQLPDMRLYCIYNIYHSVLYRVGTYLRNCSIYRLNGHNHIQEHKFWSQTYIFFNFSSDTYFLHYLEANNLTPTI